jgi:hypothetical protein
LEEADECSLEFGLNFTGFMRVCFSVRRMYINSGDAPNHALQRTPYPVPVLMVTENFNIQLKVKRAAVRRR